MAGSIDYVSFPPFKRKRKSILPGPPEIWIRLAKSFRALTGLERILQFEIRLTMTQQKHTAQDLLQSRLTYPRDLDKNSQYTASTAERRGHDTARRPSISRASDSTTTSSGSLGLSSIDSNHSATSRLQASIKRRVHNFVWRRQRKAEAEGRPDISWLSTPTRHSQESDESLIADLDALALSQPELELLRRMQQVCHAAQAAQEKRQKEQESQPEIVERRGCSINYARPVNDSRFDLHLRGGGDDNDAETQPFGGPRRRTTLPPANRRTPLPDSAQPNSVVWWLAGGKRSRGGQLPTVGELRVRKEVEQANRGIVGFWGTVIGLRRVGRVGLLEGGGEEAGEVGIEAVAGGSVASVKEASVHAGSARSIDSVKEASGHAGSARSIGSAKDESLHAGSADHVEECEGAQERSEDEVGDRFVGGDDVGEEHESNSVKSKKESDNGDEHRGETEAKEAAEAAEAKTTPTTSGAKDAGG